MSITLRRILQVTTVLVAFTVFTGISSALAQQPEQKPSAPQQSQEQQQAAQMARGELVSVDATAKVLTIKPTEGAEQRFQYTDSTKVTGGGGGVAGLATMKGSQVVVRFTSQGSTRTATEIEIQTKK